MAGIHSYAEFFWRARFPVACQRVQQSQSYPAGRHVRAQMAPPARGNAWALCLYVSLDGESIRHYGVSGHLQQIQGFETDLNLRHLPATEELAGRPRTKHNHLY